MSLNRSEQILFDYLQAQPDELHHWQEKVRGAARRHPDIHSAAAWLDHSLWDYFVERSAVAEPFLGIARSQGLARTSMKNLAELLLRLWVPPPPKPPGTPR